LVTPTGGKYWRLKYRFQGKEKQLSLGTYPETNIDSARLLRNDAKCLLKNGLDPSEERKMEKLTEEREDRTFINTSVRISNGGMIEIWKGRIALRLTLNEACFVKDQLCKLIA
jgi:Arm DNA-binding domain